MLVNKACRVFGLLISHYSHSVVLSGLQSSRLCSSWTGVKKRNYWKYLKRSILGAPAPPYKKVVQTGNPILRGQAESVPPERIPHPETQALLKRMTQIMRSCGCVGLSAPQLGVPLRVMMLELPEHLCQMVPPDVRTFREMEPFPLKIFINPTMRILESRKLSFPEGCSSVQGFSAVVPRCYSVEVSGLNEKGEQTSWKTQGWTARIVQHEMDHLDGVLYIDKMDSRTFVNMCWMEVHE
ncbi:PREDICTED: peptide deformylase, mitochondrial [Nanorana parkeri]|uniref:peptide deformylase, mitochondrial n=1 Tax=Nanorana parkeri TaxID=125878 RepID=UPI000854D89E|nr:PREDICTED: peptide deformylase, mitochondrial [Nanorana parkeri]